MVTPVQESEKQAVPAEIAFKAFDQVKMNNDIKVSIKDATIGVKKLSHATDPLQFSIRHSNSSPEQLFTFSVETVQDAKSSKQLSGLYSMTIDKEVDQTNPSMLIEQIQVSEGELGAIIDVFYYEDYEAAKAAVEAGQDDDEMLSTIEEHAKYNKVSTIPNVKMGRITLTLLKGHDRVH